VTTEEVLKAMKPLVQDGKLACRDALELAARLDVKPALIGKACNQHDIRVINCQLGCFGAVSKRRGD
jgi:hypothetical protein